MNMRAKKRQNTGLFGYRVPFVMRSNPKHRRQPKLYQNKVLLLSAPIMVVCVLIYIFSAEIKNKYHDSFTKLSQATGLIVNEINITGRTNTPIKLINYKTKLQKKSPILLINLNDIRDRLESIDWVKTSVVARTLPDQIKISIIERNPIALWHYKQITYLVDDEGVAIRPDSLKKFKGLPVIIGEDAPVSAALILPIIEKFPILKRNIVSLVRIRKRRWNLILYKNVTVKLPGDVNPHQTLEKALARLSLLLDQNRFELSEIDYIDLRLSDKVIVRPRKESAVHKLKTASFGKNT